MPGLHIYDSRERAIVGAVDRVFAVTAALRNLLRPGHQPATPKRVVLFRIERIGDLLMTVAAIDDVRALVPDAEIDLVVGSWNAQLARAIPGVTRVETLDAEWLARGSGGETVFKLVKQVRQWRSRRYDLGINFEPDLRSNFLLAEVNPAWTVGYRSGGGGPLLDVAVDYDTHAHTAENARRLVASAFNRAVRTDARPPLVIPPQARETAERLLGRAGRPLIGVHASGGRDIKQWDPDRFAAVAHRLVRERDATIALTGAAADRPLVDRVKSALPPSRVIDVAAAHDLLTLAAILERLDLFITGDTGPMHLAHAVATPIVAVFGPSDPVRYAPSGPHDRVVRIDLPCAPCNRIRLPPARCVGHTPDCLAGVGADSVFAAAASVLEGTLACGPRHATA